MKKSHQYNILSDKKCSCGKFLKKRIVELKHDPVCYKCYCKKEASRGHKINTKGREKRIEVGLPIKKFKSSGE